MGRICRVSFTDAKGIKHSAEVTSESLYEAALCGIKAISGTWAEEPGLMTPITVAIIPPEHTVTLQQIKSWVEQKGPVSPRDVVLKQRLKELLPG